MDRDDTLPVLERDETVKVSSLRSDREKSPIQRQNAVVLPKTKSVRFVEPKSDAGTTPARRHNDRKRAAREDTVILTEDKAAPGSSSSKTQRLQQSETDQLKPGTDNVNVKEESFNLDLSEGFSHLEGRKPCFRSHPTVMMENVEENVDRGNREESKYEMKSHRTIAMKSVETERKIMNEFKFEIKSHPTVAMKSVETERNLEDIKNNFKFEIKTHPTVIMQNVDSEEHRDMKSRDREPFSSSRRAEQKYELERDRSSLTRVSDVKSEHHEQIERHQLNLPTSRNYAVGKMGDTLDLSAYDPEAYEPSRKSRVQRYELERDRSLLKRDPESDSQSDGEPEYVYNRGESSQNTVPMPTIESDMSIDFGGSFSVPRLRSNNTVVMGSLDEPEQPPSSSTNDKSTLATGATCTMANMFLGSETGDLGDTSARSAVGVDVVDAAGPSRFRTEYVCNFCEGRFGNSNDLKEHMLVHSDHKPFACNSCGKNFTLNSNYRRHLRSHKDDSPFSKKHKTDNPFDCTLCGKTYTDDKDRVMHKRVHTRDELFTCQTCKKTFSLRNQMLMCMANHTLTKPFKCTICERNFLKKDYLARHKRTKHAHAGEKPYPCRICGLTFRVESTRARHMLSHSKDKQFPCSVCDLSFRLKYHLDRHMRQHTGECPYPCSYCNKAFIDKPSLQGHTRMHTGERFACARCDKTFVWKQQLQIHVKSHTSNLAYVCEVCNKGFTQEYGLQHHMKRHAVAKPFVCGICDRRFSADAALARHMNIHTS